LAHQFECLAAFRNFFHAKTGEHDPVNHDSAEIGKGQPRYHGRAIPGRVAVELIAFPGRMVTVYD
jgi:hypothetical protein